MVGEPTCHDLGVEFEATTRLDALRAVERTQRLGEVLLISDGPEAITRSKVLEQLIRERLVTHGKETRGNDRITVLRQPELTEAGRSALQSEGGHPFGEPSTDQLRIIEIVWDAYLEHGCWPIFQYVEALAFGAGLDLVTVLRSMPVVGTTYRAVWYGSTGGVAQPESPVGVSLPGLSRLEGTKQAVDDYLNVLRAMATGLLSATPDPRQVQVFYFDHAAIVAAIRPGTDDASTRVARVQGLLSVEPATWQGTPSGTGDEWKWEVARFTARFHDVASADDYLDRLKVHLQTSLPPSLVASETARLQAPPEASSALGDLIDVDLSTHVAPLYDIRRWDSLARDACTYLENFLRSLADPDCRHLSGTDLITAVLHPTQGTHPLTPTGMPARLRAGTCTPWVYSRRYEMRRVIASTTRRTPSWPSAYSERSHS